MTLLRRFRRGGSRAGAASGEERAEPPERRRGARPAVSELPPVEISPSDPLFSFFQSAPGVVDLDTLELDSPALQALKAARMKLVVPLVSQGELIGLLNLGPRLSEQDYSADDRKLLENLAAQAAPAVRVGQLVQQQQAEIRERERLGQELRVAQLIQQQFLPRQLPELQGWQVGAYYRPAREVGGDFYDFLEMPDGQVGIVVGDVTDKGVPAALVMATTHSLLRAEAPRLVSPGRVLERVNDLLYPEMPARMFVTCLYAVLDPASGSLRFANAGHNLPYVRGEGGVTDLRATGMPLGLMPEMSYEEKDARLQPGESLLLHSDGLAEAHNEEREMFGFPRLMKIMGDMPADRHIIDSLLTELDRFTGPEWEQEDDITLVTLQRSPAVAPAMRSAAPDAEAAPAGGDRVILDDFTLPSEPGNERMAMERVVKAVAALDLPGERLDRLKTAVAEATMNAIEHGNENRPELPVAIRVLVSNDDLHVEVTDRGGGRDIPEKAERPDLEAKLAGLEKARGWGLYLIQNMVDDMHVTADEHHHTVELILHLKGGQDGSQTP